MTVHTYSSAVAVGSSRFRGAAALRLEPARDRGFLAASPLFAALLVAVWLLHFIPIFEAAAKLVPLIPTSAFLLALCYAVAPRGFLEMNIRIRPVAWAIPYAMAGAFSIALAVSPLRAVKDVASDWFWLFFLFPLMVKLLSTSSGRRCFSVALPAVALAYLAYWFIVTRKSGFVDELMPLDHNDVGLTIVTAFPFCVAWFCRERKFVRSTAWLACAAAMLGLSLPLGSRSTWLVLCVEVVLLLILVMPRASRKTYLLTGLIVFVVLECFLETRSLGLYSAPARDYARKRFSKLSAYSTDASFYTRVGCYAKAWEILKETSWLGAGLGNRNFTLARVERVVVLGREVNVRKRDAHSFYLSTLGEIGILGFLAFLVFFGNVLYRWRRLPGQYWRSPDTGPFLISAVGVLLYLLVFTSCPMRFFYALAFVLGPYVYYRNIQQRSAANGSGVASGSVR